MRTENDKRLLAFKVMQQSIAKLCLAKNLRGLLTLLAPKWVLAGAQLVAHIRIRDEYNGAWVLQCYQPPL